MKDISEGLMVEEIESGVLNKLTQIIRDAKEGLDPDVLAHWYGIIEEDARQRCPVDLRDTIKVVQDPMLWMKFEIKASKRVVNYLIEAIEEHLNDMPFATRLYFQKVEEIVEAEAGRLLKS